MLLKIIITVLCMQLSHASVTQDDLKQLREDLHAELKEELRAEMREEFRAELRELKRAQSATNVVVKQAHEGIWYMVYATVHVVLLL